MLILAIDTSGKSGGITLAEGDQRSFRVIESAAIEGGTFSAQLVPAIAALLEEHGAVAKDIGGFAVVSGPGSFTGLRVGLSAVKGLAEVLKKPIATVSLLEALAISFGKEGKIAAALDAGRAQIFLGLYDVYDGAADPVRETLLAWSEFLEEIKAGHPASLVTSDHAVIQYALAAEVAAHEVARPGSDLVARIGLKKLLAGDTVSTEALDANYIRRSDAELFSKTT
ncbi:MAG TPA: tRNA (adenosine(37)-N6)-threonylcarbamoyltransferase complex dimerization subunit type 1 TsaB [Verrucomicrobiae bacterium]|jgi:tRNA threonylcarbamoyladenosine biosynthesis protein TsaB|nr:tRNA (adenosine(37)-N6)-threonylcarbamoyltransferase complex dimerization subunit type 1 TsaB [Verrucomicrobiae bacterium]